MTAMTSTTATIGGRTMIFRVAARWSMPILLALLVIVATVSTPGFLTFDNLRAVLINTATVGIVAVGMTPVTLSGNTVSLGAGQSTMLAAVAFLALSAIGFPLIWAIALTVLLLVALGIVQALLIAEGLNPIITTLAVGAIVYGIVTFLTGGGFVTAPGTDVGWIAMKNFLGLPLPIWVLVVYTLITWFLVERTVYGRQSTLLGANRNSASINGISRRITTTFAFASMSVGIAIAGILSAAQFGQAASKDFGALSIDAVAAVLVGGTAIQGGEGSPIRSAMGALIIVILGNIMLLQGLSTGMRTVGVGALVVMVVCALHILRKAAK